MLHQIIELKVDSLPPMKNALRGRHWSRGYAAKKEWSWFLLAAASLEDRFTLRAWAELGHKIIIETEIETRNLFDEDNLSSIGNVCLDALKWARFIADDDPAHFEFRKPVQHQGSKRSVFFRIQVCE